MYIKEKIVSFFIMLYNNINKNGFYENNKFNISLNDEINNSSDIFSLSNVDCFINDDMTNFSSLNIQDFESWNNIDNNLFNYSKKKGRKTNIEKKFNDDEEAHSSKERDNLLKKIKTNFHKFIIEYINSVLKKKNINIKFTRFIRYFQSDISIMTNKKLLDVEISTILKKIPSAKNQKDKNKKLYEKIKDDKNINYLFHMTYVDYYIIFLRSNFAKQLINKEKNNNIEKVMITFIEYFRRKKPKIQQKYKDFRSEVYKILFEEKK